MYTKLEKEIETIAEEVVEDVDNVVDEIAEDVDHAEAFVMRKMHYHRSPHMRQTQNGSRMVGGSKPTNLEKYNKFESTSYITSDTVKQEGLLMRMTKDLWTRRRAFLWFLYAVIGVSVSLLISGILTLCNIIEKARVKATGYALKRWRRRLGIFDLGGNKLGDGHLCSESGVDRACGCF